ncbi:MAG: type II secretion system F family protein, partial [Candidatus Omnitrophica bacterium]|nr:type II secretion system F family protein [Candidatus Omnitrophota bacterium]
AVVGIATVIIMMVFVVPKITGMLVDMGETLPFATRALIGSSDFLRDFWSLLAGLVILAVFFYKRSASSPVVKIAIDKIKLKLPVLGRLIKSSEFFRFSGTLSSLLKNGIPVLSALKLTAGVIDNELIKTKVLLMHDEIKAGSSLSASIKKDPFFPRFMANMAAIGDEAGILDRTLSKVAKNYENEVDLMVKTLSSLMEPAIILIIGVIVGFIVMAMLLPIFQISLTAA